MKFLVAVVISFVAQASMANCLGEAQIVAKVQSTTKTLISCKVSIDESAIALYNSSLVCPLDLGEVLQNGIEVGLIAGHDCRLEAGDVISGVLVKTASGSIVLE